MRASGRSTLLTTRITGSPASSVLRSTNLVCGSGPSLASTSSSTPSTMDRPRSTSPPKSACPGVSTMLMVRPPWRTAVFLARIVMPFSRSRSPESITRSAMWALARNAPDCHSMASTSVVLPWSTCATMATLRRSSLVARATCAICTIWSMGMRDSRFFGVWDALPDPAAASSVVNARSSFPERARRPPRAVISRGVRATKPSYVNRSVSLSVPSLPAAARRPSADASVSQVPARTRRSEIADFVVFLLSDRSGVVTGSAWSGGNGTCLVGPFAVAAEPRPGRR